MTVGDQLRGNIFAQHTQNKIIETDKYAQNNDTMW